MRFTSKLPDVGTTIFTVMSRRALEENALNIGQGFPDYRDRSALGELADRGGRRGSQSIRADGRRDRTARANLRQARFTCYQRRFDPQPRSRSPAAPPKLCTMPSKRSWEPGDEVIIFDPAYDAYEPAVRLAGGRCVRIAFAPPAFRFDWDEVRRALERAHPAHHHQQSAKSQLHGGGRARTSTPSPRACAIGPITVLADEVYEHVLFDGRRHALGARASGIARAQLRGVSPSAKHCTQPDGESATASRHPH